MPIYDRKCAQCGHEWEAQEPMLLETPPPCPECEHPDTRRLISGNRCFILRGTGWSRDNYSG